MSDQTIDQPAKAVPEPNIGKLVIDTNVIVNGAPIRHLAKEFYTCPEVLAEVRSSHSREYLARLPFEIKVLSPSEESVKAVIDFSRKTGDFASLSMPDIKVVALTHMLEVQENGRDHIRKEPIKSRPAGQLPSAPPPKPIIKTTDSVNQQDDGKEGEEEQDDGWEVAAPKKKLTIKQRKEAEEAQRIELKKQKLKEKKKAKKAKQKEKAAAAATSATSTNDENEEDKVTAKSALVEEQSEEAKEEEKGKEEKEAPSTATERAENNVNRISDAVEQLALEDEDEEFDSDDGEWITPDNLDDIRAAAMGVTPEELKESKNMSVACMTADFAMQNTMLQMNLNLVSPGGHRVTRVKNWVLRCHACFTVTSDMDKKFCPKCGNASLNRVSCSTTSDGKVVYYLKRNYKYNLRGTKYDIPDPKGGRFVNNIVLREDQKEYMKAKQHQRRQKTLDMFDPDFIPLSGKVGDHLRIGNNMYGTDIIGYGRRNPNVVRKKGTRKK